MVKASGGLFLSPWVSNNLYNLTVDLMLVRGSEKAFPSIGGATLSSGLRGDLDAQLGSLHIKLQVKWGF